MTLTYLVSVTLDEVKLREDRPPEGVGVELRDEIASHLHSLHDVFAVERVSVAAVPDTPPRLELALGANIGTGEAATEEIEKEKSDG